MDYSEVEKNLQYKFSNISLLNEALSHSSFVNELSNSLLKDNQRMEFLGDSVLNFIISDILMRRYSELSEGELSKRRSALVNESALADIATHLKLGDYLMLGKGEINTNGSKKNSILADCLEAIIAAVYLDKGFYAAFDFITNHFLEIIKSGDASIFDYDYKSKIQEYAQSELKITPVYKIIEATGPDHNKKFKVALKIGELVIEGIGKSKKDAAQNAAQYAVKKLLPNAEPIE